MMVRGHRGQVTLEYFILFAVVAGVTLLSFTRYDEDVRDTLRHLFGEVYLGITR
jgi:hypothetical protein